MEEEDFSYIDEIHEELAIETAAVEFQLDMMCDSLGVDILEYITYLQSAVTLDGITEVTPADLLRIYNIIRIAEE